MNYYIKHKNKWIGGIYHNYEEALKKIEEEKIDLKDSTLRIFTEKEMLSDLRNTKTQKISTRIDENTYNSLKNIADDNNMKIGQVARSALMAFIEDYTEFERNYKLKF